MFSDIGSETTPQLTSPVIVVSSVTPTEYLKWVTDRFDLKNKPTLNQALNPIFEKYFHQKESHQRYDELMGQIMKPLQNGEKSGHGVQIVKKYLEVSRNVEELPDAIKHLEYAQTNVKVCQFTKSVF